MAIHLLHIETATKVCSVALSRNRELLAFRESNGPKYSHAEKINGFIAELMAEAETDFEQLDGVVVAKGPGSYTGLRIGVSTAKGIAFARRIPLVSLETLDAMAYGFSKQFPALKGHILRPMIDARRAEVYTAPYDFQAKRLGGTKAQVVDEGIVEEWTKDDPIVAFGDGAEKFISLEQPGHFKVIEGFMPSARYMIQEGFSRYKQKKFEDLASFEPFYLKDFVAIKPRKLF
jgi:tRNA threonylcarbamoyladenosine biosynthesis protein TsaB